MDMSGLLENVHNGYMKPHPRAKWLMTSFPAFCGKQVGVIVCDLSEAFGGISQRKVENTSRFAWVLLINFHF